MVDNIMPLPKDIYILIPGTCEYVYITWQRGIKVVDGIKLTNHLTLSLGRLSWII